MAKRLKLTGDSYTIAAAKAYNSACPLPPLYQL